MYHCMQCKCRNMCFAVFTFAVLVASILASTDDRVVELDEDTFDQRVLKQDGKLWIVQFYAPWCPHCVKFQKYMGQISRLLEGKVDVGVVNVDQNYNLADHYEVSYLPAFLVFGEDKTRPKLYDGEVTVAGLVNAAMKEFVKIAGKTPEYQ